HHNAGFTDEERNKFSILIKDRFIDSYRHFHKDEVKYSWWSYRFNARKNNAGWRIDYFIISNRLVDKVTNTEIHNEIYGSDHCPVEIDIKL
ncbi:MAG: exodeoxyribonuclease III, partial [Bacilli bacterium]|nr:exodeoxyribonuclease III [Bacilli bacterium]MDY5899261.1 exodeoxyribonuclease III [Bacilli bacterium]